jgi:hypothetical protein
MITPVIVIALIHEKLLQAQFCISLITVFPLFAERETEAYEKVTHLRSQRVCSRWIF